jgi:sugar phosphate isomerase/epimerase
MEFCARVGAEWLTVHAGTCGFSAGSPKKLARVQLASNSLNEVLRRTESGVKIGLENQERLPAGAGKTYIGDCFDELNDIVQSLPARARFIFDSGHANLNPECQGSLLLERMWSRLMGLHLHANQGDYDRHEPLTDAWITDQKTTFRLILKAGARGCPLIAEHHNLLWARKSLEAITRAIKSDASCA